jgi:hypothetical protein
VTRALHLPLKAVYFNEIRDGIKPYEYRLVTPYWTKRLVGRAYDFIELSLGYPPRGDANRRMLRPWNGVERQTITHPHFGPDPVEVFAIRVNQNIES